MIEPYIRDIAPDLIIVSAGFDAAEGDPLGGMRLSPACFGASWQLLRMLMRHNAPTGLLQTLHMHKFLKQYKSRVMFVSLEKGSACAWPNATTSQALHELFYARSH